MRRHTILGLSALLGAIVGSLGTMSIVHTGTIEALQNALPVPAVCNTVTVSDLKADPNYGNDSALEQALSKLPEEMSFLRCHRK
jgi:hypothetical protein